jgi:hypothetical protein
MDWKPIAALLLLAGCTYSTGLDEYNCTELATGRVYSAQAWTTEGYRIVRYEFIDDNGLVHPITGEDSDQWRCVPTPPEQAQ